MKNPPQAPRGDGEVVLVPSADRLGEWLAQSQRQLSGLSFSVGGMTADEVRRLAGQEVAQQFGRELPRPWIVSGHQPGMVHAGVWFKDAVLSALAAVTGGSAIHAVADLDSVKHPDLKIPFVNPDGSITVEAVEFADPHGPQSFAQLHPPPPEVLETLIQQATEALVWPSLFPQWAALARAHLTSERTLARWLSAAREGINETLGLTVQDVFLSDLVSRESFVRFAAEMILRHEELHQLHEEVLAEHRRHHGITDKTQPVPDLSRQGQAFEVPLWVYWQGLPRQALFVARVGHSLELRSADALVATLPADADELSRKLHALMDRCIFLAPRALTLTMYLRLFLADVFVHGIGGAVYDEVTDALAERWLGARPPPFIIATATALLPVPHNHAEDNALGRARWQAHHAYHNPERYAAKLPDDGLLRRKNDLLDRMERAPRLSEERANIFRELQRVKEEMRARLPQAHVDSQRQIDRLEHLRVRDERAEDREYFFAFMSREKLAGLIEQAQAWAAAGRGTPAAPAAWGAEKGSL